MLCFTKRVFNNLLSIGTNKTVTNYLVLLIKLIKKITC